MHNWKRILYPAVSGLFALAAACGGGDSRQVPATPSAPSGPDAVLTAPVPRAPADDAQLDTLRPALTVGNVASTQGTRTYEFQISDRSDFTPGATSYVSSFVVAVTATGVAEGSGGTSSFTPGQDLQPATRLYWRARVSQGSKTSDWSPVARFRTKVVGFSNAGELYDPLVQGATVGTPVGSTTFVPNKGIRINDENSFVRYRLPQTITNGEFSVEVEGLRPNNPGPKAKVFSMMDGGNNLYTSKFLLNVQYRGADGNPDNCIAFKAVFGDQDYTVEPDRSRRIASVVALSPSRTYFWKATWGNEFRLAVFDGGIGGQRIYEYGIPSAGTYNPSPHVAYLGANNGRFGQESGSWAGATIRNVWIGNKPRPASLGTALQQP